ncbi:hypothetical protein CTI12_AA039150 [Artemisia annua]|uniref:Reverse transcriptase domain-containing protein n=1 Tax=Artemisia annua TaxID=35608 RepID=A0A2U1QDL8_ARTAN|nr:hypothetical protein CTI12_AA039150 [Artemisia annua]
MIPNPAICTFGVEEGQFLRHMIVLRGIKTNPKKLQAILDMKSTKTLTQGQKLNGNSLSFFKLIKEHVKKKQFKFLAIEEAKNAFQDLKVFLTELPTLTALIPFETLTMYLEASNEAIGSVLEAKQMHSTHQ